MLTLIRRNREEALERKRKITELRQAQQAQQQEESDTRRKLVGSGDRSEKIRTYNYPQGRVTDHRIKLTLYSLEEIMSGELDSVIQPLINEHQADLLVGLSDES